MAWDLLLSTCNGICNICDILASHVQWALQISCLMVLKLVFSNLGS